MTRLTLALTLLLLCGCAGGSPEQYGVEMVRIPGGTFAMGSDLGREDERPAHRVNLSTFTMSKTEVTVGQFKAFVRETGYRTEAERGEGSLVFTGRTWEKKSDAHWGNPGFLQNDTYPVTCVSWNDCQQYIQWLNRKTGRRYRLPTEAEWEYAAGDSGRADVDDIAWSQGDSAGSTHPVGQKQPNAYGLHDMIGNVWEWCSDWYGAYSASSQSDPTGPASGSLRVNRGGAWYGADASCQTRRGKNTPDDRGNGLGFRLAEGDTDTRTNTD